MRITSSRYSKSSLKRLAATSVRMSRFAAVTNLTSTFRLNVSPTRRTSCCWITRSSLA